MTDEKVKADVQFISAALSWYDGTEASTDVREAWSRLQAERDKLAAEVERLTKLTAEQERIIGEYQPRALIAEAKLTALVEATRLAANALEMVRDFDGFVPPLPKRRSDAQAQESQILEDLLGAVTRAAKATRQALAHHSAPPSTPTSAPVVRDTTKLPAKLLTDAELIAEQTRVEKLWDGMFEPDEDGEVFEGHGGSPGEWMQERMIEVAHEQQQRAAAALIQPQGEDRS